MSGDGSPGSPEPALTRADAIALAERLYRALEGWNRVELDAILHPAFVGRTTEGLPAGLGGTFEGPVRMIDDFWAGIGRAYQARAVPGSFLFDDGILLVRGRYVGSARTGRALDAAFTHVLTFADGRIDSLDQVTDSERWVQALQPTDAVADTATDTDAPAPQPDQGAAPVLCDITDGLAVVTLNRPEQRGAMNQPVAAALRRIAVRLRSEPGLRAVLIRSNGPVFSVGGDVDVFASTPHPELPSVLSGMIADYHAFLAMLDALAVPVVAAARGAAAGGSLGLLHVADTVLLAEGTKIAAGFSGVGLSGDGGSTWFLPRLVGPKRAGEFYLEQRVLDAAEAVEWGIATRTVPEADLDAAALAVARRFAAGPTVAHGRQRTLLRRAWDRSFPDQLAHELTGIVDTSATGDAGRAIQDFLAKRRPTFEGR